MLNAARDVRHGVIGAEQAHAGQMPAMPNTQTIRMPAMKNSALHTSATSMVWPKSGCSTSSATTITSSISAKVFAGMSGRLADSPNSQAIRMTKAGLRNSDGCTFMPNSDQPAPRALDLGAEHRR